MHAPTINFIFYFPYIEIVKFYTIFTAKRYVMGDFNVTKTLKYQKKNEWFVLQVLFSVNVIKTVVFRYVTSKLNRMLKTLYNFLDYFLFDLQTENPAHFHEWSSDLFVL